MRLIFLATLTIIATAPCSAQTPALEGQSTEEFFSNFVDDSDERWRIIGSITVSTAIFTTAVGYFRGLRQGKSEIYDDDELGLACAKIATGGRDVVVSRFRVWLADNDEWNDAPLVGSIVEYVQRSCNEALVEELQKRLDEQ